MTTITNNKLTDERVSNAMLIRLIQWADQHNSHYVAAALCELQERRKANCSEPVLYTMRGTNLDTDAVSTCKSVVDGWVEEWNQERKQGEPEYKTVPLYAAPPVSEREQIRREHAEWSDKTFGDVGPVGPLKHLSKEALEAAADPSDPLEWADMQFLLWDAQRRMGLSDEFITRAMIEKLEINKSRQWPEPKDGEPRLHIKEQPVPVVPEEITADGIIGMHECGFVEGWNACRAAMLQGKFRDLSQPVDPQVAEYEQIMLQADWVMVPVEPTDEMIAAAMECDDVVFDSKDPTAFCVQYREIYCAMVDTAPALNKGKY